MNYLAIYLNGFHLGIQDVINQKIAADPLTIAPPRLNTGIPKAPSALPKIPPLRTGGLGGPPKPKLVTPASPASGPKSNEGFTQFLKDRGNMPQPTEHSVGFVGSLFGRTPTTQAEINNKPISHVLMPNKNYRTPSEQAAFNDPYGYYNNPEYYNPNSLLNYMEQKVVPQFPANTLGGRFLGTAARMVGMAGDTARNGQVLPIATFIGDPQRYAAGRLGKKIPSIRPPATMKQ